MRYFLVCMATIIFFITGAVQGENIYIAQTAQGLDNGAGASNAHAAAWFNTAANWGTGAGKIGPGDTVRLCGAISTGLTVNGSGTAGNPITIFFETNAKLSAPVWTSSAMTVSNQSWIVIDGANHGIIECTDNGTALGHKSENVYGIYGDRVSHIVIQNLTVNNLYVRTPGSTTDILRAGVGVNLSGSDIIVRNCTLKEADTMIGITWNTGIDSNITIHGNVIGRCNHGITIGTSVTNAFLNNVEISNNSIDDLDVWNGVSGNHLDGIIIFNESSDYSGCLNNLMIFSNKIGPNIGNINTSACFVICYKAQQVQGMKIYNNLFTARPPYYWTNGFVAASGLDCIIANNTMIGNATGIETKYHATCYNNLLYNAGAGLYVAGGDTVANFDYNVLYFAPPLSSHFLMVYNTNSDRYYTMPAWMAATGFDSHSTLFKPDIDTATGIPSPIDTVAAGHGKNLSNWFTTDYNGNPRPLTGAWTIGAFEHVPGTDVVPSAHNKQSPSQTRIRLRNASFSITLPASVRSPELTVFDLAGREVYREMPNKTGKSVYTCAWHDAPTAGIYFAVIKEMSCKDGTILARTEFVIGK